MTTKPKVQEFGSDAFGVKLYGNPANPEKTSFRVEFPGGDVDVIRTTTGDYWIHVRVNRPEAGMHIAGETPTAHIVDARLDIHGRHASEINCGDFADPDLYHAAFRIRKDPPPSKR